MQALYVALIALVIAMASTYVLAAWRSDLQLSYVSLLIYLGPPAAASILVFFLMKPIFAKRRPAPKPLQLTPDSEPVFFQFIDRLCHLVGSPTPKVIYADLEVNATASLQDWRGFFLGDLALTIGVPLVRGLTLAQFTGVLAHEFGHFSQRAGMRSHFLIQTIRAWFARVVYERDSWDDWLEQGGDNEGWQMRTVRHVARGGVWLSRRYLELLMKGGHRLSAEFSRQSEFDADRYETSVVGPEVFEQTSMRLPELSNGAMSAWEAVRHNYRMGRLPDDVAIMVETHTGRLTDQTVASIREQSITAETGRFDSHPATVDRITQSHAWAKIWATPGCFTLNGPALRLFQDLDSVGRAATAHHYRLNLGDELNSHPLVPTAMVVGVSEQEGVYRDALIAAGGTSPYLFDWFELPPTSSPGPDVAGLEFDAERYGELVNGWMDSAAVVALIDAGAGVIQDVAESRRIAESNLAEWSAECLRLQAAVKPMAMKLCASIPMELLKCQHSLESSRPGILGVRRLMAEVECLRANSHLFDDAQAANQIEAAQARTSRAVTELLDSLKDLPSAVALDPSQPATLAAQLRGEIGAGSVQLSPTHLYARWCEISIGTLGRICWYAQELTSTVAEVKH